MSTTEIVEGLITQESNAEEAYIINTTAQTTSPTSPSVVEVFDLNISVDVKLTVMPTGSASVSDALITLPILKLLEPGHLYRVFVKWTDGSSKKEIKFNVECPIRNK